jgi:threonine aldolase
MRVVRDVFVDLRSDTVTRPTPGMRAAMAQAEVGDDVYGEDPTIRRLEETVADLFGHEAAVFTPTGTMANQIALRLVCPPAGELLCDTDAHIVTYEGGGAAAHGGIQTRTIPSPRGLLHVAAVSQELRLPGYHAVVTRAVAVENTHNRGGGAIYPLVRLRALRALVDDNDIALHCDGARIWNAHVATGTPLSSYGDICTTLSVCLSKGLGAPVGSLVVCSAEQAAEARSLRHRLGGAWRQAGILAAAGLYALQHHLQRLDDDHRRAALIAAALDIDPSVVDTNIVLVDVDDSRRVAAECRADGVLVSAFTPRKLRLVTHLDVDDAAIDYAVKVVAKALR